MTNVMVKTCLNQKIIKNSNLIQAMKISLCPKAKVIRRPNFSESRIFPNIYRMFQSVDRRHDKIIVKWHSSFDTSANFALWQMRHRFNPHKRVNDYQRYSMLIILPLRSISCTLGNSSSLWPSGDDHFFRYYNPLSAKKDILKIFLCIWWWQMWWWKHVLTRKL